MTHTLRNVLLGGLLTMTAAVAACGGGGGSSRPAVVTPPTPPVSSAPTWQQGVFPASSTFKNQCASVRTGTDINGDPYPDLQGTDLEERFWLRSWSDELYLWYNEITDQNPANFTTKFDQFDDGLKTFRTTASGNPVDQFHFYIPSDEYEQLQAGGAVAGYGIEYALVNRTTPRDIRVAFTQPNSPAAGVLARGAEILEIDGVDVVNDGTQAGVDTINAGLFPGAVGESHEFVIRDAGATTTRTITLAAENVVEEPVLLTKVFDIPDGNGGTQTAGYIVLNTFGTRPTEKALFDAFTSFENADVDELFVDLRYNGGGFLDISAQMAYMIAGDDNTSGKQYDELIFNDKTGTTNPVTGRTLRPTPFYDETLGFDPDLLREGRDLPSLDLDKVSILSTDGTCSASEALINGLVGADVEVDLIGGRTCGKPYGFYPTDNCGTTWFTIQFRGANDKGFGDFADGFVPVQTGSTFEAEIQGCTIADDFTEQLGDPQENLLEYAIARRTTGVCPSGSAAASSKVEIVGLEGGPETAIGMTPRLRVRELIRDGRILSNR